MDYKKVPQMKVEIRNQGDTAEIDINGEIGWVNENGEWNTAANIKNQLKEISQLDVKEIIVNINSLGGFIDDGLAIHDVLASHKAKITTRVSGMTASAATVISQAGDVREMSDNALFLIHRAWGLGMGNYNDIMAYADDLKQIDTRIANIYAKRGNKNTDTFMNLMNENNGDGRWVDAQEAKDKGLVDKVYEPMKAAASVSNKIELIKAMGLPYVPERIKVEALISDIQKPESETISDIGDDKKKQQSKNTLSLMEMKEKQVELLTR